MESIIDKYISKLIKEELSSPELLPEAYPESFDMQAFKALPSYKQRLEYAAKHLKGIKGGSGRYVLQIDEQKVLKLAKNVKGVDQNRVEAGIGRDSYFDHLVTQVFDFDDENYYWIEAELAKPVGKAEFRRIVGVDIELMERYLRNQQEENNGKRAFYSISPEEKKILDENEFVGGLLELALNYDIQVGDWGRVSSFGKVTREGHESVVIIDYGLSGDVFDTHYSRASKRKIRR